MSISLPGNLDRGRAVQLQLQWTPWLCCRLDIECLRLHSGPARRRIRSPVTFSKGSGRHWGVAEHERWSWGCYLWVNLPFVYYRNTQPWNMQSVYCRLYKCIKIAVKPSVVFVGGYEGLLRQFSGECSSIVPGDKEAESTEDSEQHNGDDRRGFAYVSSHFGSLDTNAQSVVSKFSMRCALRFPGFTCLPKAQPTSPPPLISNTPIFVSADCDRASAQPAHVHRRPGHAAEQRHRSQHQPPSLAAALPSQAPLSPPRRPAHRHPQALSARQARGQQRLACILAFAERVRAIRRAAAKGASSSQLVSGEGSLRLGFARRQTGTAHAHCPPWALYCLRRRCHWQCDP